jgi:hypothetical protein
MELIILRVSVDRYRNTNFELLDQNQDDEDYVPPMSGDYVLVKIETLNDRIAVEEFIENLKNK